MSDPATLGSLVLLALIDSLSFGTLLIPVWLLMAPGRARPARVLLFLGTVALAYGAIGLALLSGLDAASELLARIRESRGFLVGQLLLGIGLLALSQTMDSKRARARHAERIAAGEGRIPRWRTRAMGDDGAPFALMGLALAAVAVEVVTMLPYLAAIGIITTAGPGGQGNIVLLGGYCLVMIAPALLLTAGRTVASRALGRPLSRLDAWLTRHAQSTTAWVIGILGVILALRAVQALGWIGG